MGKIINAVLGVAVNKEPLGTCWCELAARILLTALRDAWDEVRFDFDVPNRGPWLATFLSLDQDAAAAVTLLEVSKVLIMMKQVRTWRRHQNTSEHLSIVRVCVAAVAA